MPVVLIPDEKTTYKITATVIAGPESTRVDAGGQERPRWMEATLYRKDDGTGYILHTANYSRVWHLDDDSPHVRKIRKPAGVPSAELPDGAVYCGDLPGRDRCPPLRQAPGWVIIELPQHKLVRTVTAGKMIEEMIVARRGRGTISAALSEPMRNLQIEAEENDPAFAAARPVIEV